MRKILRPLALEAAYGDWVSLRNGIHVKREDGGLHLTAVVPCKIKGSQESREPELPLEVETEVKNVPAFDAKLLSEMTAQLARKLTAGLPCTNNPDVPGAI